MRVGVQLPHFGPLASGEDSVALARSVEEMGFDSVWVGDHVLYPPPMSERFGATFYEAVVTLAYIAATTRRIRLGTAVLILPYRNPILLAKQLATLDALCGGRLVVGVGAGWLEEEFAALGARYAERGAVTDESIRILRTLWTEARPRFAGRWHRFGEMVFAPQPVQRPLPLWVGGDTPRAVRRAAELGDGWLPIWHAPTGRGFTPEALRDRVATLTSRARAVGRGERPEVAGLMPLAILDRPAGPAEAQPLVGPPEVLAETLTRYAAAGLGHVIVSPYYGLPPARLPQGFADVERVLARFARDVRPQVDPGV